MHTYLIEFVKFIGGFAVILGVALVIARAAGTSI
jgi:hypothetical protein